jgi:hypothetical protein
MPRPKKLHNGVRRSAQYHGIVLKSIHFLLAQLDMIVPGCRVHFFSCKEYLEDFTRADRCLSLQDKYRC